MTNERTPRRIILLPCVLLLLSAGSLFAQTDEEPEIRRISLLPFWGEDDDMQYQFGRAVFNALTDMDGYEPFDVDMANRSADVPDGGFPPYVAPHPSLTGDIPYGITGNVAFDEPSNQWQLFLYLWQLDVMPQRLLWSDMSSYDDIESANFIMPFVLEALLAWIPEPDGPLVGETQIIFMGGEGSQQYAFLGEEWWYDWLYVGLRIGWNPQLLQPLWEKRSLLKVDAHWNNYSIAAHANVQFLDFLSVQLEGIAMFDMGYSTDPVKNNGTHSLTIPILVKYMHRRGSSFFSVLAGGYWFLPFKNKEGGQFFENQGLRWGYTAGFGIGNKAGPGNIFMETRWSNDMFGSRKEDYFNRSIISVSVGYEMGFFKRKLATPPARQ